MLDKYESFLSAESPRLIVSLLRLFEINLSKNNSDVGL